MTETQQPDSARVEPPSAAPEAPSASAAPGSSGDSVPAGTGRARGVAVAALVLGIVALVLGPIPFVGYVGAFLALVGLVLGVVALLLKSRSTRIAIAGTIASAVALILSIVLSIACTAALFAGVQSLEQAAPEVQAPAVDVPVEHEEETRDDATGGRAFTVLLLGQTMVWDDGIEMTVSGPAPFDPGPTATGVEPGWATVYFEITIANRSTEALEPLAFSLVSSGGGDGAYVVDVQSGMEGAPTDTIRPGESITWQEAYAVLDPADVAFQTSPGLLHAEAVWTTG